MVDNALKGKAVEEFNNNAGIGWIPDSLERGFYARLQSASMAQLFINIETGSDPAGAIKGITRFEDMIRALPPDQKSTAGAAAILKAGDFKGALKAVWDNPGALLDVVGEGLAFESPTIGAAMASLSAGPFAPAAMIVSTASLTAHATFGQQMVGAFKSKGYDLSDPSQVKAGLQDPAIKNYVNDALIASGLSAGFSLAGTGIGMAIGKGALTRKLSGETMQVVRANAASDAAVKNMFLQPAGDVLLTVAQTKTMEGRMPTPGELLLVGAASATPGAIHGMLASEAIPKDYLRRLQAGYSSKGVEDISYLHIRRAYNKALNEIDGGAHNTAFKEPAIVGKLSDKIAPNFKDEIMRAANDLPPTVKKLMGEYGVETKLAQRITDVDPQDANRLALGYEGLTGDYSSAHYNPARREIVMSQENRSLVHKGEYVPAGGDFYHTYLHESGHALDDILTVTWNSQAPISKLFAEAYAKDIRALNGSTQPDRMNIRYFLEQKAGGVHLDVPDARSEAFAELFAEKIGGESIQMTKAFPETAKALDKILQSVDHEMQSNPNLNQILRDNPRLGEMAQQEYAARNNMVPQ